MWDKGKGRRRNLKSWGHYALLCPHICENLEQMDNFHRKAELPIFTPEIKRHVPGMGESMLQRHCRLLMDSAMGTAAFLVTGMMQLCSHVHGPLITFCGALKGWLSAGAELWISLWKGKSIHVHLNVICKLFFSGTNEVIKLWNAWGLKEDRISFDNGHDFPPVWFYRVWMSSCLLCWFSMKPL